MKSTRTPRTKDVSTAAQVVSTFNPISFAMRQVKGEKPEFSEAAKSGADAIQNAVDLVGLLDPTGISHLSNMILSLMRAREEKDTGRRRELLLRATVSGVGAIPIFGKAMQAGRAAGAAATVSASQGLGSTLRQASGGAVRWATAHPHQSFIMAELLAKTARPALFPRAKESTQHRLDEIADALKEAGAHLKEADDGTRDELASAREAAQVVKGLWGSTFGSSYGRKRQAVRVRRFARKHKDELELAGLMGATMAADAAITWRENRRRKRQLQEAETQEEQEEASQASLRQGEQRSRRFGAALFASRQSAEAPRRPWWKRFRREESEEVAREYDARFASTPRQRVFLRPRVPWDQPSEEGLMERWHLSRAVDKAKRVVHVLTFGDVHAPIVDRMRPRTEPLGGIYDTVSGPARLGVSLSRAFASLLASVINLQAKFILLTQAARMSSNALVWMQHPLSQYSGTMAAANVRARVAEISRERRKAGGIEYTYASLQGSRTKLEETVLPYSVLAQRLANQAQTIVNMVTVAVIRGLEAGLPGTLFRWWYGYSKPSVGPTAQIMMDAVAERSARVNAPSSKPPVRSTGRSRY